MSVNCYSSTLSHTGLTETGVASPRLLANPTSRPHTLPPIACDTLGDFQQALYLLGVPSLQAAYREAQMNSAAPQLVDWSHPVVYLAGCATGWEPLHNHDSDSVLPIFQEHFRALSLCLLAGVRCEVLGHSMETKYQGGRPSSGRQSYSDLLHRGGGSKV